MSRYIDADALEKKILKRGAYKICTDDVVAMIADTPTVDAVQVVASDRKKLCPINHGLRCKDIDNCAFWCEWGQCAVKAIAVACADRERKDE